MEVPHRCDLIQESCVNKEVEKFNSIVRKHMKLYDNAEVLKVNLDRKGFTTHGQHMNTIQKEWMAKRIVEAIKHTLKAYNKTPIIMKLKEDINKDNHGPQEARNNGRDHTEKQSDSVQEEENNMRQEEEETGVISTRRS